MEQWKEIFDGYLVSSFGNVDSFKRGKRHRLSQQIKNNGYLQVGLRVDGKQKYFCVHRLVATAFVSNPDGKPQVNHIDGNKQNNRAENLEWCTQEENQRHALATGLKITHCDEKAPAAKLTNEQVVYIRNNPDKLSCKQLGDMFGVRRTTIGEIQLGNHYKTVGGKIRNVIDTRITDDVRKEIKRLYKRGKRGHGTYTLAKKFGLGVTTVKSIVHEND